MIGNVSSKAVAWAGISVLTAGVIAGGTVVTEGLLFRIKEANAAVEAAKAETAKSRAEMQKAVAEMLSADAARLAAENSLRSAIEARNGVTIAAEMMANAQRAAAEITAKAAMYSTEVDRHVDNSIFDHLTGPMFIQPVENIGTFNKKMVRLKREAESGIDGTTRRMLTASERADRIAQAKILDEEASIESETSAKTMGDTVHMLMSGFTQSLGDVGSLYPNASNAAPVRRIVQEAK